MSDSRFCPDGYISSAPRYFVCDELRDDSPDGLTFLYTLDSIGITRVMNRFTALKYCMIHSFEDDGFLGLSFPKICSAVAKSSEMGIREAEDALRRDLEDVWNAVEGTELSHGYSQRPAYSEILALFCGLAAKYRDKYSRRPSHVFGVI